MSGAANAGIPSSFYAGKDHLPAKEHYEKVIQVLIDSDALKEITRMERLNSSAGNFTLLGRS